MDLGIPRFWYTPGGLEPISCEYRGTAVFIDSALLVDCLIPLTCNFWSPSVSKAIWGREPKLAVVWLPVGMVTGIRGGRRNVTSVAQPENILGVSGMAEGTYSWCYCKWDCFLISCSDSSLLVYRDAADSGSTWNSASATVSFYTLRKMAQESAFSSVKSRLTHFEPVPFKPLITSIKYSWDWLFPLDGSSLLWWFWCQPESQEGS